MLRFLRDWTGPITINDKTYASFSDIPSDLTLSDGVKILLQPKVSDAKSPISKRSETTPSKGEMAENTQYKVKVKRYMTQTASPDFDFMAKWNNNTPMPLRVMVGEKIKETRGMVYMTLHGDILEEKTLCCMKCGTTITNPVSQFFGMGPECGGHNYTHPFDNDEDLQQAVEQYKAQLKNLVWEGWIIKSAIEEMEEM